MLHFHKGGIVKTLYIDVQIMRLINKYLSKNISGYGYTLFLLKVLLTNFSIY